MRPQYTGTKQLQYRACGGEDRVEMPKAWGLGGEGSPAGIWDTVSLALLKPKVESLPWEVEPQVQLPAGSLVTYLVRLGQMSQF